jgi:hypothetical protein
MHMINLIMQTYHDHLFVGSQNNLSLCSVCVYVHSQWATILEHSLSLSCLWEAKDTIKHQ